MPTPPTVHNRHAKERIGIFGLPKIGKSHMFWTIAKWHQDLGSDAKFYGINTDTAWEVLAFNEGFSDLTNIEWSDAENFQEMLDAAKKYHEVLRPQDWLCVDLMDDAWNFVQDEYARLRSAGKDVEFDNLGDLFLEPGAVDKYPISGWDWGTPNARYRILANNYILRGAGHRMIISGQAEILKPSANMDEDETARKTREMFSHIGVKPAGQKGDAFRWHTLLHVTSRGEKQQAIATAGERYGNRRHMGRKMGNGHVKPEAIEDFFLDYLVNVAGWSMD